MQIFYFLYNLSFSHAPRPRKTFLHQRRPGLAGRQEKVCQANFRSEGTFHRKNCILKSFHQAGFLTPKDKLLQRQGDRLDP